VTCCSSSTTRLSADTLVEATVASGSWTDFYYIAENEGDSLAFELSAASSNPTALGVYVYDGSMPQIGGPNADRCVVCEPNSNGDREPQSTVEVTPVTALHPEGAPTSSASVDSDVVSHIGNTTHRRYFAYVGECYHMVGSVYYLSVYGQTASTVSFTVSVNRVPSALTLSNSASGPSVTGTVCDGKYMHYFFDVDAVHAGGLLTSVRKTSGELNAFYLRAETCAGTGTGDLYGPINLRGYGTSVANVRMPSPTHANLGRYYVTIRGSDDMCGEYNLMVRNLTQHEFHAAPH